MRRLCGFLALALLLAGCTTGPEETPPPLPGHSAAGQVPFEATPMAGFEAPTTLAFLPGTDWVMVGERTGAIWLRNNSGMVGMTFGLPEVFDTPEGGLGDIVVSPTFAEDQQIFLSWTEGDEQAAGAVVGRATVQVETGERWSAGLDDLEIIWRQAPEVAGDSHFSQRLAISPDGQYLFVSSGDRGDPDAAQDLTNNLGTIVRLNLDGTPAADNPFASDDGIGAEIWSFGHNDPAGLAFDAAGNLWSVEPAATRNDDASDRLNLIVAGGDYAWMGVEDGAQHPQAGWGPSITPTDLTIYTGDLFSDWTGDGLVAGLSDSGLTRALIDGTTVSGAEFLELDHPIRAIEQAPDGSIWVLDDDGQLLRLTPA